MPSRSRSSGLPPLLATILMLFLFAAPASAQTDVFPTVNWTVQPSFGQGNDGRDNISGLTCLKGNPLRDCLVVNDGVKFAQLFSISGTTIHPGSIVGFAGQPQSALIGTPNAEGAAHDGTFLYIVTSRGRIELPGQTDTSFLIFRFKLDATGRPDLTPGPGMEVTDRVQKALATGIPIQQLSGQQLDQTNTQIEGIAVRDGVVHLGLRTPVLSGKSFILSMPLRALFSGVGPLNPTVNTVTLGPDKGMHDLAAVADGILILAGPGRALFGRPSIFHWNETTGLLKPVANIVEPFNRSAEGLLVLQDDPEFFRVLLMFDGVTNGGPIEYFLPR